MVLSNMSTLPTILCGLCFWLNCGLNTVHHKGSVSGFESSGLRVSLCLPFSSSFTTRSTGTTASLRISVGLSLKDLLPFRRHGVLSALNIGTNWVALTMSFDPLTVFVLVMARVALILETIWIERNSCFVTLVRRASVACMFVVPT